MDSPRSIVITGASSGIGEALAYAWAAPGVSLALTGRDAARLDEVAAGCRARGATVDARTIDVTDSAAMARWLAAVDAAAPVDLVVANAGVSAGTGLQGETDQQTRRIFAVNVDGVFNTVLPLLPAMRARRRGQVAVMSSLAGFRGFAGAPAYCASKAAVRVWGEALRGDVRADGVEVSVICPGFVVSRMTAVNRFPMPLIMTAGRAAGIIVKGLARNRARIAFPLPMLVASWLAAALPAGWSDRLLAGMPKKSAG
jgi:short-subunit dehydrogenase